MSQENSPDQPEDQQAFQYLVRRAGLNASAAHLAELQRYVQSTLAALESVREIDVHGTEPDLAFIPRTGA
jgi:hypothetical protein